MQLQSLSRCWRYYDVMATIQIRDVPAEVHRKYRERAAAAGQSLQEYLLGELCENASAQTPAEMVAEVEEQMRVEGPEGWLTGSSADLIRADRERH